MDKIPFCLATDRTKLALPSGVKEIVIKSAAYTIYQATLTFIHTGFVHFAPLLTPSLPARKAVPVRSAALANAVEASPSLPLPASPKSVYKLAPLLEIYNLAEIALADYKSRLTVENVLFELVTDISVYDPACEVLVASRWPTGTRCARRRWRGS